MTITSYHQYLAPCCTIVRDAGKIIMGYYTGTYDTKSKGDNKGPVTDADVEANRFIRRALSRLTPDIPIVAEEDEELNNEEHQLFWLVDPLDGTRSFVRGEPEFTVNIALVTPDTPLLGIIYAPPQDALYYGYIGKGAFRALQQQAPQAIHARAPQQQGMIIARSRSHPSTATQAYLDQLPIEKIISCGSSIKFCMVAEGTADIYPRFGRTMEWDTAAGHAILHAAGGRVETTDGHKLTYGKPHFENPHFIAYGK